MIITSEPDFWHAYSQRPLLNRIATAPTELLDYVSAVNASENSSSELKMVQAYTIPPDFLADIQTAIAELPETVKIKLEPHLLGVFVASGVGSSAITDVIVDQHSKLLGAVILLDAEVFLARSANTWMTWKESTPFAPHPDYQLAALIADATHDHRWQAIQYLLLHELGHVLSINSELLPNWWIGVQKFKDTEEYPFLSLCWQIAMNGEIIPLIRHNFEQRTSLRYYGDAQVGADQMSAVYQALSKTTFPTLYAATSVYEDFAESFASYVHVVLMGKPWQIQILQDGQLLFRYADYWTSPRAQGKAQIFTELLQATKATSH